MRPDHHEVLKEARLIRAQIADQARELPAQKIDQLSDDGDVPANAKLIDMGITPACTARLGRGDPAIDRG